MINWRLSQKLCDCGLLAYLCLRLPWTTWSRTDRAEPGPIACVVHQAPTNGYFQQRTQWALCLHDKITLCSQKALCSLKLLYLCPCCSLFLEYPPHYPHYSQFLCFLLFPIWPDTSIFKGLCPLHIHTETVLGPLTTLCCTFTEALVTLNCSFPPFGGFWNLTVSSWRTELFLSGAEEVCIIHGWANGLLHTLEATSEPRDPRSEGSHWNLASTPLVNAFLFLMASKSENRQCHSSFVRTTFDINSTWRN